MKRIEEFEKLLLEKTREIEQQDEVEINDFDRFLTSDGTIMYRYTSVLLGCEITAVYKGRRYYGNDKIRLTLNIEFE
jgi:hypothetical protein